MGATAGIRVMCTDLEENLPLIQTNLQVNSLSDQVTACALDWRCAQSRSEICRRANGPFDAIVVADCVFWPELFQPLLDCLIDVLSLGAHLGPPYKFTRNGRVLSNVRRQRTVDNFMASLHATFAVSEVENTW